MLNTTSEPEPNPPPAYLLGYPRPNCHPQRVWEARTGGGRTARSSPRGMARSRSPAEKHSAASSTSS